MVLYQLYQNQFFIIILCNDVFIRPGYFAIVLRRYVTINGTHFLNMAITQTKGTQVGMVIL